MKVSSPFTFSAGSRSGGSSAPARISAFSRSLDNVGTACASARSRRQTAWAASNGDRSENGDYIYGKRRLREIDRRIRFLNQRLAQAAVVDPARPGVEGVYFGATVTYGDSKHVERTVSIVGQDEVDPQRGRISWISPVARALGKAHVGDVVKLNTPAGVDTLEVIDIRYIVLPD